MKTLLQACIPRESVFDCSQREDVIDLTDLINNRINPKEFFEETYITQGMRLLFDAAFKRFHRQGQTGIIKLTQTMGGGKTHNMVALGLLAKYPELRAKILGDKFKDSHLGKINVVAFTGRESDVPYGIWGAIADQLGKKEMFKDYYAPLQAPGQTAWINLLRGEPLLILLDELPPYLENAKSKLIGDTNLAVITTTALANLFNALAKDELSNVCLVISDLKATYESGSELLRSSFKELEAEINRFSLDIEPVQSTSDEIYHILKKRLFSVLPDNEDINEIAIAYKNAVNEAKQMGLTNISPEQIYIGVKDSYPFHPILKDLYARFKENTNFQQTRGLIRLMRIIVSQLYKGENPLAANKYLINVYDFDLNDQEMYSAISNIKQSLTNAISHDIASNGKAIAEVIDKQLGETYMSQISKLILMSSLSEVPNAVLGLHLQEIIAYLCEPNKDMSGVKKALEDFQMQAWYLHKDKEGRLYFQNVKNIIAEMNSLIDSYDNESAKKELKSFLLDKFTPKLNDCYQNVLVFPAIDEINLSKDKVTLIITEPYMLGDSLNPELINFYEQINYKNRVMFLTGQRSTMERLYQKTKELKAISTIVARMKNEFTPETDPQFKVASEKMEKIQFELKQIIRETFQHLYYPTAQGLQSADFTMEFKGNEYNPEQQIRDVLLRKLKFTTDISDESFRKKCEARLFTQKEMRWVDIEEKSATNPSWQWHHPQALTELKNDMLRKGIWRENGGYIEKGPFPKEKTSVLIQELRRDADTDEVVLKIVPQYGDKVYYDYGNNVSENSNIVENLNEFRTNALKLAFLCIDSTGEHQTGDPVIWKNKLEVKYRTPYLKDNKKVIEIKSNPNAKIKYTFDGSNPKDYGIECNGQIEVPDDKSLVLVVAEAEGEFSEVVSIKVDIDENIIIDKQKPIKVTRKIKTNDTKETYEEMNLLKKHNAKISDVTIALFKTGDDNGWLEIMIGNSVPVDIDKLESIIEQIRSNIMSESKVNINFEYSISKFNTGQDFLDYLADKKKTINDFRQEELVQ
ncbi:DUF499 domain-containing protein [Caldicellulosiruptoraceae bacterium PP1]